MGERAGFYELSTPAPSASEPAVTTAFAANCSIRRRARSACEGARGRRKTRRREGFHVASAELWIYLLLLVALISAIEWATYHRR